MGVTLNSELKKGGLMQIDMGMVITGRGPGQINGETAGEFPSGIGRGVGQGNCKETAAALREWLKKRERRPRRFHSGVPALATLR